MEVWEFRLRMKILEVKIDNLSKEDIFKKIDSFLDDGKFHQIATVNPEIILASQKDAELKEIVNYCDLSLGDGMGIKLAAWKNGEKLKIRIPGIDLMIELFKIANEKNIEIFLAADKNGLSSWEETKEAILKIYPNLEINGADLDKSTKYKIPASPEGEQDTKYKILFCNFGAPFQEKFLNGLKNDIIGIAVGVGGSFDYLTGRLKRAPKWMQFFGIEWMWRLILQPKRFKRIFNAIIIFPLKIVFKN
jgi:N-acetylglucosaminyldiphosphoundecaprenol N-acetyl-beta-D-mannosaminyltransferase